MSGIKAPEEGKFEKRLYMCRGKRVARLKQVLFSAHKYIIQTYWSSYMCKQIVVVLIQVPFARSSLNHDDVFILDTEDKIFQFNGANSSMQERSKALDVVQFLKDKYHKGKCKVAIVGRAYASRSRSLYCSFSFIFFNL